MSSSPPAEISRPERGRWRKPASWPLRTRLVAIIVVLLTLLGIAVGAAAESYLRKQLYDQVDAKLNTAMNPFPGGQRGPGRGDQSPNPAGKFAHPFIGADRESMALFYNSPYTSRSDIKFVGIVTTVPNTYNQPELGYHEITDPAVVNALLAVKADRAKHTITLPGHGSYRAFAQLNDQDVTQVFALPLTSQNTILLQVAMVTGGTVLIVLGVASWVGALVVRRTLLPLDRVAATATRVSELRLDRGEVRLAQRVPAEFTDPGTEVGQVGAALNRMLDHVGNALEARHTSEMQVRQFVADASHELRTPLAAIRGYAELSRRSRAPVSEEIAHVLGRVESEAKRMTGLVEDLLLLARLDAGRPLAHDPVDLTMLVVDAVSDAHAAGPRHYWQLDLPDEPVTVVGDQQRLHQVLANLLANARTHTPEGTTVTVSVSATHDAAVLRVIDFGPGIPEELQPHIFERFARGDGSRSRAAGSTGLGLSIVAAVVAAHRGDVSVQSRPGQTVFTVVLPLVPPSPAGADDPSAVDRPGPRQTDGRPPGGPDPGSDQFARTLPRRR